MIENIPLEPLHLELLQPDTAFQEAVEIHSIPSICAKSRGSSLVDMESGEVVACYGYIEPMPGVYWVWMVPSLRARRNLIRIIRHFRRWFESLKPGTRIECHVLKGFEKGERFATAIGLAQEIGVVEAINGRPHSVFSMTKPGEFVSFAKSEFLYDAAFVGGM